MLSASSHLQDTKNLPHTCYYMVFKFGSDFYSILKSPSRGIYQVVLSVQFPFLGLPRLRTSCIRHYFWTLLRWQVFVFALVAMVSWIVLPGAEGSMSRCVSLTGASRLKAVMSCRRSSQKAKACLPGVPGSPFEVEADMTCHELDRIRSVRPCADLFVLQNPRQTQTYPISRMQGARWQMNGMTAGACRACTGSFRQPFVMPGPTAGMEPL